jgi:peptidoglycan-associated lipoprotein
MTRSSYLFAPTLLCFVIAGACHHARPTVVSPPAGPNADSMRLARARADSVAAADAARRKAPARAAARVVRLRRAADAERLANQNAQRALSAPVHFALDQSNLESADRNLLDQKATILNAHAGLHLRIEGNADERGSDEYNLALGMRRAAVVRRYLVDRGIDSTRLAITSNGEERPTCQTHDESCWSQNRRDEFFITAGENQISMRP